MKTNQMSQRLVTLDEPSIRSADDVVKALEVEVEKGIRSQEAPRRLVAYGPNELRAKPALSN